MSSLPVRLGVRLTLNLRAQLDRLAYPRHQLVKRLRLGMTSLQCGDRRAVILLFISLDNDIELSRHAPILP